MAAEDEAADERGGGQDLVAVGLPPGGSGAANGWRVKTGAVSFLGMAGHS
ncbi:hypothetical protein [Streptomyces sp. Ac-502]